jgi:hypothetical protein
MVLLLHLQTNNTPLLLPYGISGGVFNGETGCQV